MGHCICGDSLPELQLLFRRSRNQCDRRSKNLRQMPPMQAPQRENLKARTKKTTKSDRMIYNEGVEGGLFVSSGVPLSSSTTQYTFKPLTGRLARGFSSCWMALFICVKGGAPFGIAVIV